MIRVLEEVLDVEIPDLTDRNHYSPNQELQKNKFSLEH
jgi:hypothetical protein